MTTCKRGARFLLSSTLVLGAGCDGGDDGEKTYTHAADIQPLWDMYCVAECHSPEGVDPTTGLYLPVWTVGGVNVVTLDLSSSEVAYMQLMSGQSELYTSAPPFVTPGDAAEGSYLMDKIFWELDEMGEPDFMTARNGGGGLFMPSTRATDPDTDGDGDPDQVYMSEAEVQVVSDWIAGGAMP